VDGRARRRLVDDLRRVARKERLDNVEVLLWAWLVVVIGFFSLSAFKLDHYVFPAAPAACLLCARALSSLGGGPRTAEQAWSRIGLLLVGPVLAAIGVGTGT